MKKTIIFSILTTSLTLFSCTKEEVSTYVSNNTVTNEVSEEKNSSGLKEALKVGVDTAVSRLNVSDGYFKDIAIKLLLPPEMQSTISTLKSKSVLGLSGSTLYDTFLKSKEDDLILGINRAAEKAAGKAKPIFVNAITGMTLVDAKNILFGTDTAATHFLKQNTYNGLVDAFSPEMQKALDEVTIGSKSVSALWSDYVSSYNGLIDNPLNNPFGQKNILGLEAYKEVNLSEYATKKGLNGLFLKVSDQEKKIRFDPIARVTDLLAEVFGQLDKKTSN